MHKFREQDQTPGQLGIPFPIRQHVRIGMLENMFDAFARLRQQMLQCLCGITLENGLNEAREQVAHFRRE